MWLYRRTWLQVTSQAQFLHTPCLSDINVFRAFLLLLFLTCCFLYSNILSPNTCMKHTSFNQAQGNLIRGLLDYPGYNSNPSFP